MHTSKKYRHNKKKYITSKLRGGQAQTTHPGFIGPALNLVSNVASGVSSAAITGASKLMGVDLTNKDEVNSALQKEIKILSDPETRENIKKVIGEGAQTLAVGLEAAKPAINKFVETTTEAIEKSAKKIGDASVSVALNTLEEIPMVGVLVGTIRSADKATQAAQSIFNAGSEIVAASGDVVGQVTKSINNKTNTIAPTFSSMKEGLGSSIKDRLGPSISSMKERLGPSISSMTGELTNKFGPSISNMRGELTNKFGPSISSFKDKLNSNQTFQQMKDKFNEKTKLLNKIGGSISDFHDSTINPEKFILQKGGKNKTKQMRAAVSKNYSRKSRH